MLFFIFVLKELFKTSLAKSKLVITETVNNIWEEAFLKVVDKTSSKLTSSLKSTYNKIATASKEIYKDVELEKWFINFSKCLNNIRTFLAQVATAIKSFSKQMKDIFMDSFQKVYEDIEKMFEDLEHVLKSWIRYLIGREYKH